jgi:hypothetical protein
MFSIGKIKKELSKFLHNDYFLNEMNRIKKELTELEAFKKIKEPTQKHLNQLEKQYTEISKKITQKQKELDKEFNNAVTLIKKRRTEAQVHIKDLQKMALEQKNTVEKLIKKQMISLGLAKPVKKTTLKKKKKAKKTTSKKA